MGSGRLPAARVSRELWGGTCRTTASPCRCLAEPLNKLGVNWLMGEFWFTAGATFAYFTAFVAMLVNFSDREDPDWQYWIDANIAAGVFGLLNDIFYGLGAYLIYVEWKANPTGAPAPPPA